MAADINIDIDKDGIVEEYEQKLTMARLKTMRRLAITSMFAICIAAGVIVFYLPEDRLLALGSLLDLFWITCGGIIATYMGSEAWVTKT